jgi:hypothetical protein
MWEDICALQRFVVNRGLVKYVVEEAVGCEVTNEAVEMTAKQTESVVLGRMQTNSVVPPLNLVIWDAYVELGYPGKDTMPKCKEAEELKNLVAEFQRSAQRLRAWE